MIRKKEKNRLITGGLLSLVFTSAAEKHEYLNQPMDMLMPHALLSTISEKLQACLTSLAWQFVQWNYKENNRQDLNAKYILNTEGATE